MTAGKTNIIVVLEKDTGELTLKVGKITLGEKSRKKMKNDQLRKKEAEIVLQAVCALLNSGGGVIKMKIENEGYSLTRHGIGLDLENGFRNILPSAQKYLHFVQEADFVHLFVKSRSENTFGVPGIMPVVTLKTNLYRRNTSCSIELNVVAALELLKDMQKTGGRTCTRPELRVNRARTNIQEEHHVEELAADCFNKTQFTFKQEFYFRKSTHVEVKLTDLKKPLESIIKTLPRSVSSLANTDGGYLFFGLDGKKKQIIGFKAEKSDRERLERNIENCIHQLPVHHFCKEKQGIKYKCKFIEVHGSGEVCRCVLALRVERFCCAVFAEKPDSWHVEGNCVPPFTTEEWVQRLMDANPG